MNILGLSFTKNQKQQNNQNKIYLKLNEINNKLYNIEREINRINLDIEILKNRR